MERAYRDREWLIYNINKYGDVINLCRNTKQAVTTIRTYIKKYNLEHLLVKPPNYKKRKADFNKYPFKDKQWLKKQVIKYGNVYDICKGTGCSETSIRRYIKMFELQEFLVIPTGYRRHKIDLNKYPYKSKEWLIQQIQKYKIVSVICKNTNMPETSIRRYIKEFKLGYMIEKPKEHRNYMMKEDYFESIDTEEKAYFLGLLMADGNVVNDHNRYCIRLSLKSEDVYLLEFFLAELESDSDVKIDKYLRGTARVWSKKMFYDLNKLNIIPNKTGKEKMPHIPEDLINHFIRGFFDGDGTIYKRKNRKRHKCTIGLCCQSEEFIKEVNMKLNKYCNVTIPYYFHKNNAIEAKTESLDKCKKILEWMYKDASIAMIRKYKRAKEYVGVYSLKIEQMELN